MEMSVDDRARSERSVQSASGVVVLAESFSSWLFRNSLSYSSCKLTISGSRKRRYYPAKSNFGSGTAVITSIMISASGS